MNRTLICVVIAGLWFAMEPALAKPPPWAPAHGWRSKNDPFYVGYGGRQWSDDYGVIDGRCDTDKVRAVLGDGAVGNKVASPEGGVIATVVGAVVGELLGDAIGRQIDKNDRACVGQSLELARVGQRVRWTNPATGHSYTVRPKEDLADGCRKFELARSGRDAGGPALLKGCAGNDGRWQLR